MMKSNLNVMSAAVASVAERRADEQREADGGAILARPDPEVSAKAKRRQFTPEYKQRVYGKPIGRVQA